MFLIDHPWWSRWPCTRAIDWWTRLMCYHWIILIISTSINLSVLCYTYRWWEPCHTQIPLQRHRKDFIEFDNNYSLWAHLRFSPFWSTILGRKLASPAFCGTFSSQNSRRNLRMNFVAFQRVHGLSTLSIRIMINWLCWLTNLIPITNIQNIDGSVIH